MDVNGILVVAVYYHRDGLLLSLVLGFILPSRLKPRSAHQQAEKHPHRRQRQHAAAP